MSAFDVALSEFLRSLFSYLRPLNLLSLMESGPGSGQKTSIKVSIMVISGNLWQLSPESYARAMETSRSWRSDPGFTGILPSVHLGILTSRDPRIDPRGSSDPSDRPSGPLQTTSRTPPDPSRPPQDPLPDPLQDPLGPFQTTLRPSETTLGSLWIYPITCSNVIDAADVVVVVPSSSSRNSVVVIIVVVVVVVVLRL